MADYNKNDVKRSKKSNTLITEALDEAEYINISDFISYNRKGVNITSNSTFVDDNKYNRLYTSAYADTVVAKNGSFDIYTTGQQGKKITTGDYNDSIHIVNNGKNTINTGNGKNSVIIANMSAVENTITTGNGNDSVWISSGKNKVTDKGGNNKFSVDKASENTITAQAGDDIYTLENGQNKITDKGGTNSYIIHGDSVSTIKTQGDNTFEIEMKSGGKTTITSGKGKDVLNILNYGTQRNDLVAKLGDGIATVTTDFTKISGGNTVVSDITTGNANDVFSIGAGMYTKINSGGGDDTFDIYGCTTTDINAGAGDDTIDVHGGMTININAGAGNDTITVSSGENTIYGGKGDDKISATNGTNIISGDAGSDEIVLSGGTNTVYGDSDQITVTAGINDIYAKGDIINISNGTNTLYTKGGGNMIYVTGGYTYDDHEINLTKGNNNVSVTGDGTRVQVNITAGKNSINIADDSVVHIDASTAKTAQYLNIEGSSFVGGSLGKGNDTIITKSDSQETNELHAGAGNDKFYISDGEKQVFGDEGDDYFELTKGSHYVSGGKGKDTFLIEADNNDGNIFGEEGNDTFIVNGGTNMIMEGGDGNDNFTITGGKNASISGNTGKDIFNITDLTNSVVYGDEGDDVFNVSGGTGLELRGADGKNTYNISGGKISTIAGGDNSNIFNISGGTINTIDSLKSSVYNLKGGTVTTTQGSSYDDTFNLSGGEHGDIYGYDGDDTFNITGGSYDHIYGGYGHDTYNIKNVSPGRINDDYGNETYNIYNCNKTTVIQDGQGINNYNIKKDFYSSLVVLNMPNKDEYGQYVYTENNFTFDKSFKLTSSKNIKSDGSLKTGNTDITFLCHYYKDSDSFDISFDLIMNIVDEYKNESFDEHTVSVIEKDFVDTFTFGGKKYNLDLTELKADLTAWFTEHTEYDSTSDVFKGKIEADINSLMAVYVEDTAACFVKA